MSSNGSTATEVNGTRARAGRREWIGLAVLALPCLLYAMDVTVLTLAVPALTADLEPTSTELLWIVDVYGFFIAGFLITMGTLGDRIGRRRLLLIGAAAFGGASVLAAFSSSPEMLIVARALLGIAGATLAPSTLSLIRSMFEDPRQRTKAIGIWITSFSVGAVIGPLVGGILLEYLPWGSVFLLAVPVMLLLLAVGPRLLPEYRDPNPGRLDLVSAALSLLAVLAVILGIKLIALDGFTPAAAVAIAGGVAAVTIFLARQRRLEHPLIDLGLFKVPAFGAALATNTLAFAVAFGVEVFFAQYLQLVLGLSALEAGLWSVPGAVAVIVGAQLTPVLVARIRPAAVLTFGLGLAVAGLALMAGAGPSSGLGAIVAGSVLLWLGLAPVFTLAVDLAVGAAPPERAGAASGVSETSSELGGAIGIAVLGTIGTAVYRADVPDSDTLGGVVEATGHLPDAVAASVLEPARAAFTHGFDLALGVGGLILLAATALVVTSLRGLRPEGEAEEPETTERPSVPPERPVLTASVAAQQGCA